MGGRLLIFRNFAESIPHPGAYQDPPLIDFLDMILIRTFLILTCNILIFFRSENAYLTPIYLLNSKKLMTAPFITHPRLWATTLEYLLHL